MKLFNYAKRKDILTVVMLLKVFPNLNRYTRQKSNRDYFLSNSNTTHFQSTNIPHMSLEVLDLDFDQLM